MTTTDISMRDCGLDLSTAGTSDISVGVQCHTDLSTCCKSYLESFLWRLPHGSRLPFSGDIPTNEVHGNTENATMYVGLYTGSGGNHSPQLVIAITE